MSFSRIIHSPKAYLRYMQMSQVVVFGFVEGQEIDPYFYGQICAVVSNQRQIAYQISKTNEIPPNSGEKRLYWCSMTSCGDIGN